MSPVDPLGLVTNLVTLGQLLSTKLADTAARRAVLTEVARAAVDHFGEDAPFIVTEVLGREEVSRQLLAPPSAGRLSNLKAWFRDAYIERPDRVTGQVRLEERVDGFIRDVDDLLLEHGLHEAQALGQKIEAARADVRADIAASENRLLQPVA